MRFTISCTALLLFATTLLEAQNSVYGTLGIGFPGRPWGPAAASLGGGPAAFDARSAHNPAGIAALRRLTVMASTGTIFRDYTARDTVVNGLTETRFPFGMFGGAIRRSPFSIAVTYSLFAERNWNIFTMDSVDIRGQRVEVTDQLSSDGSMTDIRGAIGWRIFRGVNLGAAFHKISGSARLTTIRRFSDPNFQGVIEPTRLEFSGIGFSAGATFSLLPGVNLAAAIRTDTELKTKADSIDAGSVELPMTFVGGLSIVPHTAVRLASTITYRSWSDARSDLAQIGAGNAFDTWEVGSGLELGSAGASPLPVRVGFRYSELPFSPTNNQPREISVSGGTALVIANGRAVIDLALERLFRDGGGASERAWYISAAVTISP